MIFAKLYFYWEKIDFMQSNKSHSMNSIVHTLNEAQSHYDFFELAFKSAIWLGHNAHLWGGAERFAVVHSQSPERTKSF